MLTLVLKPDSIDLGPKLKGLFKYIVAIYALKLVSDTTKYNHIFTDKKIHQLLLVSLSCCVNKKKLFAKSMYF